MNNTPLIIKYHKGPTNTNGISCQVVRSDLHVDLGRSINPAVDIGQIEGAFIQVCPELPTGSSLWFSALQNRWFLLVKKAILFVDCFVPSFLRLADLSRESQVASLMPLISSCRIYSGMWSVLIRFLSLRNA